MMRKIERENTGLLRPGQDLVVAGYAGLAGTCRIVKEKRQELRRWFSEDYLDQVLALERQSIDWKISLEQHSSGWKIDLEEQSSGQKIDLEKYGAAECEEAGDGGIFTAIWNLSGAYETGMEIVLRRIPIRQETVEICERYELNPYRLYSGGCYLLASENGGRLVLGLEQQGIAAKVVGQVKNGISREIINVQSHGYLERPQPDELWKVVKL